MSYYLLVDCNNFYASCERVFNPSLEGKPVAVLSQNDGCIIARSQEAKQLGIKMGEPYFKIQQYCKQFKVYVFSSNYQLYGDISRRIMNILSLFAPEIEVYSIDEAFMKFPATITSEELFVKCTEIRKLVKKWVGIPISIGMAPTKTLAKLANNLAKRDSKVGVFNLCCPHLREDILDNFPIEDVWGIGYGTCTKLRSKSIFMAGDFIKMDPHHVRKILGVCGERMLWELKGLPALGLEKLKPKKNICYTRCFGQVISEYNDLAEAVSTFISRACIKLRAQGSYASALQVYVETAFENGVIERKYTEMVVSFFTPTNDTSHMISAAKECLKKLYKKEQQYRKAGIFLLDLVASKKIPLDMFEEGQNPRREALMNVLDGLNERFGKNTVFFGAQGINQKWKSRSEHRSEYNTTDWKHLPIVYARSLPATRLK